MAGGARTASQNRRKTAISKAGGAESGAISYTELLELLQLWAGIPGLNKEIALNILKTLAQDLAERS